mmetsp:Transcript_70448/g.206083  ORF Transcript_70448/g.206083 Transcript_70448/m.206083 type:complete len:243 (-) Transcript_70448:122-850(-)
MAEVLLGEGLQPLHCCPRPSPPTWRPWHGAIHLQLPQGSLRGGDVKLRDAGCGKVGRQAGGHGGARPRQLHRRQRPQEPRHQAQQSRPQRRSRGHHAGSGHAHRHGDVGLYLKQRASQCLRQLPAPAAHHARVPHVAHHRACPAGQRPHDLRGRCPAHDQGHASRRKAPQELLKAVEQEGKGALRSPRVALEETVARHQWHLEAVGQRDGSLQRVVALSARILLDPEEDIFTVGPWHLHAGQ